MSTAGLRDNFRFAGLVALTLAVANVWVAGQYHLPIRDPDDTVVPTYVRLPAILLLALMLDVVPRAIGRELRTPRAWGRSTLKVIRERWTLPHFSFALAGLGTWYVCYAAFRNLKSYVPFVNQHLWDRSFERIDRAVFAGHDPATVLHDLVGTGLAAHFFSTVYAVWIVFVPVSLAVALVWTRHTRAGSWFVTAIAVDWMLGVATYFLLPTLGPIYYRPGDFTALPHTLSTTLQQNLLTDRQDVLADPFATHALQTIAAFPSLHVGIMMTVCLAVEAFGLSRWIRRSAWGFLVLTVLATVYLGWHFASDTVGGMLIGALAFWIAALGTGNHVGLVPKLFARDEPVVDQPALGRPDRTRSA